MNTPTTAPSSPMQVPATWDAVAEGYAQEAAHFEHFADQALRTLSIGKDARVLDVGTGPGTLALLAAQRGARVSAVDFSPAMIEQLRARAAHEAQRSIETAVMDAQSLDLPDGSFDAAFSLFAFMFIPDRARAFRELLRVLRPGGRALVATWGPIERRPLMKFGFDALAEVMPELPRMQKGDLQQPEECIAEMSAAGFRDVECRAFTALLRVESPDHYLQVLVRTGAPFPPLRKRLGEEAWRELMVKLRTAIAQRIPEHGMELAAESMLTTGTR
jgi:ubiquinone/menaquinone biosynthesis C-methylase UbiE